MRPASKWAPAGQMVSFVECDRLMATFGEGRWVLRDEGKELAEYSTDDIRVSLQMKVPPGGMLPNILPKPFQGHRDKHTLQGAL